jgi:circadian clock protein KaiB
MSEDRVPATLASLEAAVKAAASQHYVLVLYVSGITVHSQEAIENAQRICRESLAGRYSLQIVDINQQPELAEEADIVVAPTLLKKLPPPLRRIIGNLVDRNKVLAGLGLTAVAEHAGPTQL